MGDAFDLLQSLAQGGALPPGTAAPVMIEASALPQSQKRKLLTMISAPNSAQQAAQQASL